MLIPIRNNFNGLFQKRVSNEKLDNIYLEYLCVNRKIKIKYRKWDFN